MSATEVTQLKVCVGGVIAMISFLSTTKDPTVAERFAGNGEHRPDIESVIFEIIIDESVHDHQRAPFADISAFSWNPAEEEVLLCVGTVLRVESVETKGQVTWFRVRTCKWEESEVLRTIKSEVNNLLPKGTKGFDQIALSRLLAVLFTMNDHPRLGQIGKMLQSMKISPMDPFLAKQAKILPIYAVTAELTMLDADMMPRLFTWLNGVKQMVQSLIDSNPLDPGIREYYTLVQPLLDALSHFAESGGDDSQMSTAMQEVMDSVEERCTGCIPRCWDVIRERCIVPCNETAVCRDSSTLQSVDAIKKVYCDKTFPENDFKRIWYCLFLANDAYTKGDYDEGIRLLRDGLTTRMNREFHVPLYRQLLGIYKIQGNWLAAIECCQDIIKMPELPLGSPTLCKRT